MRVTSAQASIVGRYPRGQTGIALLRRDLDAWILDAAMAAGAHFEAGLTARHLLIDDTGGRRLVRGVGLSRRGASGGTLRLPATLTIAADGRRSALARAANLVRPARAARRWAWGTYVDQVEATSDVGEMHIRSGWYMGIAPIADGLVNICVVTRRPRSHARPLQVMQDVIATDPALADRLRRSRFDHPVRVLGPLASDVVASGVPGLLLAGDAGGFVDPMTGDGLHLAIRSGQLAAREAAGTLEHGDFDGAAARVAEARRAAFGAKLRFNRAMRRLVDWPAAVEVASVGARLWPGLIERAVRYAGDAA
jgi:flavin-dependent dehydrogenase